MAMVAFNEAGTVVAISGGVFEVADLAFQSAVFSQRRRLLRLHQIAIPLPSLVDLKQAASFNAEPRHRSLLLTVGLQDG